MAVRRAGKRFAIAWLTALVLLVAVDAAQAQLRGVYGHRRAVTRGGAPGGSVRYSGSMGGTTVQGGRGFSARALGQHGPRFVPVPQSGITGSVRHGRDGDDMVGTAAAPVADDPVESVPDETVERRLGESVAADDAGHTKITHAGKSYYVRNGQFYHAKFGYKEVTYERVEAPLGATVKSIPDAHETRVVGGKTYYLVEDVTYEKALKRGRQVYVVVKRPPE